MAETLRRAFDHSVKGTADPKDRLYSSHFDIKVGSTIRISGRGFGHGVGLCQYGAEALAHQGRGYESILSWYYPEATIRRTYA